MENFCQFWNRMNGEPYQDVQPPTHYEMQDMEVGTSSHELRPLADEDMARYSADDVAADMERKKKMGFNPTRLGNPMSDEEFHKFHGLNMERI